MKLSRRAALALATSTLAVSGLMAPGLAGALPVAPDGPVTRPTTTPVRPSATITWRPVGGPAPRYVVQADRFFCGSETGLAEWADSDEPRFGFVGTDETGHQVIVSRQFTDVDSGESGSFGPLDLSVPMAGPYTLSILVQDENLGPPDTLIGQTTLHWSPNELAIGSPAVGATHTEQVTFTGDNSSYTLFIRTTRVA